MKKKSRRAITKAGFQPHQTQSRAAQSPSVPSPALQDQLQQITHLGQSGHLAVATTQCQQFLQQHPQNAQAWYLLSVICIQQGQPQLALEPIQKALQLSPHQAEFLSHAGIVQCGLGEFQTGIDYYQQALHLQPELEHTRFNLGLALEKTGQLAAAEQTYQALIAQQPQYAPAYLHLGNLYQQQKRFTTAIAAYRQAIQHQPQLAAAWCNLGVALQAIAETASAQTAFQQALGLKPNYVEALNGLGATYEQQEQASQALQSYQQSLIHQPNYLPALINLGSIQIRLEQFAAAEATLQQILRVQPDHLQTLDQLIKLQFITCQWSDLADRIQVLKQALATASVENGLLLSPLNSLYLPLSAAEQKRIAEHHAGAIAQRMAEVKQQLEGEWQHESKPELKKNSKIRLGYVSGDFRYHPVGQLILRLFELHDRQKFEVFAYSLGPEDDSLEQQKLQQDCDRFRQVWGANPAQISQQIRQDQIDILIDLAGYTNYACPELFALRSAPLQVNYLGYPGTLGASYMDYIITDAVITPPELAPHLTEQCLYLPDNYQLNCYPYPGEATDPSYSRSQLRQANHLPIDAFVFCCFNKCHKIEPTIFTAWMEILNQVPHGILWLLSDRPEVEANLCSAAAAHGIQPDRLIFAERVSKANHLQRQAAADLFLDTRYYNAHVTASDALWAGVPIITVLGQTFASRVAASLLTAAGIPELITQSLDDYVHLAVRLSTHTNDLKLIRTRLSENRSHAPLFNTAQRIRDLETGYQLIWQRHQVGLAAATVTVARTESRSESRSESNPELRSHPLTSPPRLPQSPTVQSSQVSQLAAAEQTITCIADDGFANWLSQAKGSLLISTYQAGKVLLVGWDGQQVTLLPREFQKPMGMAVSGDRLALATRQAILFFSNARSLAPSYLPQHPNRYDALYLPRSTYLTGDLYTHELGFGQDGLWVVNTRFSCLASLSLDYSFVPRWYPAFISQMTPEDRCHLNGLAMVQGKPKYVTALGEADCAGGWRANKAAGGILIEVETDEILRRGLSMPHSPRWYQEKLWLLNSGTGELWQFDPVTWNYEVVCALPGFGRGLSLVGHYALVGLSQIRETQLFGGLPLQERGDRLQCGVAIVNLITGQMAGLLEFPTGCQELFDIQFLPNLQRPNLLALEQEVGLNAFTAPEFAYWLRTSDRSV